MTEESESNLGLKSCCGDIEKVVYHSDDTGFVVLKVALQKEGNKRSTTVTVTGILPQAQEGQSVHAVGQWIENRNYGKQFKADELNIRLPKSEKALMQYLSSGVIKGVGKVMAEQLLKKFGTDVLNVIENHPQKLAELPGIGPKRSADIQASWKQQQHVSELMLFLQEHGIGMQRSIRIYKTYGEKAITLITANPFRLARDISGISFTIADKIAASLGIQDNDPARIHHGVLHQLRSFAKLGHSAVAQNDLIQETAACLGLEQDCIANYLDDLEINGNQQDYIASNIDDKIYYYQSSVYKAEKQVARRITTLCTNSYHTLPTLTQLRSTLSSLDDYLGYKLSATQRSSLEAIFSNKVNILTGGPGVGKTTLVQSVVYALKKSHKIIKLCAPTGRAAKRLQESTGHPAQTIHRTLGIDPVTRQFVHNAQKPLHVEYCVIDECSMLDIALIEKVLTALPDDCGVLLVGDIDQLPSVGPGKVLKDLIDSQRIPVVQLTEIFRQQQTSCIIEYAHRVRLGKIPAFHTSKDTLLDCYGLFYQTIDDILPTLKKLVQERIPKTFNLDAKNDVQLLCPMHKGLLGTAELNKHLQSWVNPSQEHEPRVQSYGQSFVSGDKVMQTKNNYDKDVFNGDIGIITRINTKDQQLTVQFDKPVTYYFDELDELQLAYAMSIHKSQGSEFPAVILPLFQGHYLMLERTLLYTAMTRAKKLLILLGQKKALHMAIHNHSSHDRLGFLKWRLDTCFKDL